MDLKFNVLWLVWCSSDQNHDYGIEIYGYQTGFGLKMVSFDRVLEVATNEMYQSYSWHQNRCVSATLNVWTNYNCVLMEIAWNFVKFDVLTSVGIKSESGRNQVGIKSESGRNQVGIKSESVGIRLPKMMSFGPKMVSWDVPVIFTALKSLCEC